jgi:hypothetical protein
MLKITFNKQNIAIHLLIYFKSVFIILDLLITINK